MTTVVFTVYSDKSFWLDVSRIELLLGFTAVSAEVVEAVVAWLLADITDKPVFGIPDSRSIGATCLGESALGAGPLS